MSNNDLRCSKCKGQHHPADPCEHNDTKVLSIYKAIQEAEVGGEIIIHNGDGSVWCILEVKMKDLEHPADVYNWTAKGE